MLVHVESLMNNPSPELQRSRPSIGELVAKVESEMCEMICKTHSVYLYDSFYISPNSEKLFHWRVT